MTPKATFQNLLFHAECFFVGVYLLWIDRALICYSVFDRV